MHVSNYSINFTQGLLSRGFAAIKQKFFSVRLLKSQVILTGGVMINFTYPLTGPRGAQISGYTLFLGMSLMVFPEESGV